MAARVIAVSVVLAFACAGFQPPLAMAQPAAQTTEPAQPQQAAPAETQVTPQPPPAPAQAQEMPAPERRGTDIYDVGAGAMTALGIPLKATTCVVGSAVGVALFVATFGMADYATASIIREGCDQRWIVRGSDLRPNHSSYDSARSWDSRDGAAR